MGTTYCTAEQAQAAGAVDAVSVAVLEAAAARIDLFTGTWFDLRVTTLRLEYDGEGLLFLPAPAAEVTGVATVDPAGALPAGRWRLAGDRLYLPDLAGGFDVLVAGAEPWRGGWANLYGQAPVMLDVTGTFGPPEVPAQVADAAAMLAALLAPRPYTPTVDAEGVPQGVKPLSGDGTAGPDPETVGPWGTDRGNAGRLEETTGLAEADRLLATWANRYRRRWKVG